MNAPSNQFQILPEKGQFRIIDTAHPVGFNKDFVDDEFPICICTTMEVAETVCEAMNNQVAEISYYNTPTHGSNCRF